MQLSHVVVTAIKIHPRSQHAIADSAFSGVAFHSRHRLILTRGANAQARLEMCSDAIEEGMACRVADGLSGPMFLGLGVDESHRRLPASSSAISEARALRI
jgi:hypothetical protein